MSMVEVVRECMLKFQRIDELQQQIKEYNTQLTNLTNFHNTFFKGKEAQLDLFILQLSKHVRHLESITDPMWEERTKFEDLYNEFGFDEIREALLGFVGKFDQAINSMHEKKKFVNGQKQKEDVHSRIRETQDIIATLEEEILGVFWLSNKSLSDLYTTFISRGSLFLSTSIVSSILEKEEFLKTDATKFATDILTLTKKLNKRISIGGNVLVSVEPSDGMAYSCEEISSADLDVYVSNNFHMEEFSSSSKVDGRWDEVEVEVDGHLEIHIGGSIDYTPQDNPRFTTDNTTFVLEGSDEFLEWKTNASVNFTGTYDRKQTEKSLDCNVNIHSPVVLTPTLDMEGDYGWEEVVNVAYWVDKLLDSCYDDTENIILDGINNLNDKMTEETRYYIEQKADLEVSLSV